MGEPRQPQAPATGLPNQPMLRPGVRAVRSDDHHLRVGLGPEAVMLPDRPATRDLVARLADGRAVVAWDDATLPLGRRLGDAGLLVDGAAFWRAAREGRRSGLARQVVADAFAAGGEPTARLARRLGTWVALDLPDGWRAPVTDLLAASGVTTFPAAEEPLPSARLVARLGEPRRDELDPLVRSGEPHLLMRVVEGRVTVGPFVDAGRTACCRCVDAHLSERDPRRPIVVEQYADPSGVRIVPEPVSPTLLAVGWALAAHDLVAHAEGREPATWSATITLDRDLTLERTRWSRHPCCGCGWAGDLWGVL